MLVYRIELVGGLCNINTYIVTIMLLHTQIHQITMYRTKTLSDILVYIYDILIVKTLSICFKKIHQNNTFIKAPFFQS